MCAPEPMNWICRLIGHKFWRRGYFNGDKRAHITAVPMMCYRCGFTPGRQSKS